MKKLRKNIMNGNEKVVIATVDIGSRIHYGYWRCGNNDIEPFKFSNDAEGFQEFWEKIASAQMSEKADKIVIGLESTGSYGVPLLHYLSDKKGVELVQVNPMNTKRVKELGDNSPEKSDRKDPRVIADILSLGYCLSVIIPRETSAEMRNLAHAREREVKKRTAAINQVHGLMAMVFPEFGDIMKRMKGSSALYLMDQYPLPEDIVGLGVDGLTSLLRRLSRGRLGKERAERLFAVAQHSIGITEGRASMVMELRHLVSEIRLCTVHIKELEKAMKEHLEKISYSKNLLSIPRIGKIRVATIIGEVGDFKKFHSSGALIKLAGLNLYTVSSGNHKGEHHITKFGRMLLRTMVYFASLNMVGRGGIMHDYYQKLIQEGTKKVKALIAVPKKLLRLMFALVRDDTMYDPNYGVTQAA